MQSKYSYLKNILKNSYSPYSKFKVAALVETDKGDFIGVNVENLSYGLTVCAERNAIFQAVSNGARKFNKLILISSSHSNNVVPCAACLQVMTEFFKPNTKIEVFNVDGKSKTYNFKQFLPIAFKKEMMK